MSRQEVVLEATIDAPPETVWKVVSDPKRFPEWLGNVKNVKIHGSGPLKKGTKMTITAQLGSHQLVSDVEVTHFTEPELLGWRHLKEHMDGKPFEMVSDGETELVLTRQKKGTHVRSFIAFTPQGFKAKLAAGLVVTTKLKPEMANSLKVLKGLCESSK